MVKAHVELEQYDKVIEEAMKHVKNEQSIKKFLALGYAQLVGDMIQEVVNAYRKGGCFLGEIFVYYDK